MEETRARRPGRRSDAEAVKTRQTVAEAALRVFAERGFAGASLRDIATAAGTAHGLIRHHFGSKDGVWRAAVDYAMQRLCESMRPHMERAGDASGDPVEETRAALRMTLATMRRHPEIIRLIFHEGVTESEHLRYALDQFSPIGEGMKPLMDRVQAAGYLRQFDNRTFFLHILTAGGGPIACPAVAAWVLEKSAYEEDDQVAHVERFLATILPAEAPPLAGPRRPD